MLRLGCSFQGDRTSQIDVEFPITRHWLGALHAPWWTLAITPKQYNFFTCPTRVSLFVRGHMLNTLSYDVAAMQNTLSYDIVWHINWTTTSVQFNISNVKRQAYTDKLSNVPSTGCVISSDTLFMAKPNNYLERLDGCHMVQTSKATIRVSLHHKHHFTNIAINSKHHKHHSPYGRNTNMSLPDVAAVSIDSLAEMARDRFACVTQDLPPIGSGSRFG